MFLPPFFESKKFKIIYAVTMGLLLLMIVSLKIYDSFCEMPGCWNLKDAGTQYCWDHINSIYENSKKKSSGSSNGERIYNSFELFNQSQKYHYTPKRRNTPTPVPRNIMVIPILPGRVIRMMSVTMMIRMILPMIGLMNLETEIMMVDTMMRMTTGKKTEIR